MTAPKRTTDTEGECSIIALDKFIQATRDSGYKGTASALAELVDNSLQAGAKHINVSVAASTGTANDDPVDIDVSVADDGSGMDAFTLRQALRFGGSSRFGDRRGLGRYGMGLPNASLSQSKRVVVWTWQSSGGATEQKVRAVFTSHLDVDEIARGEMQDVPVPVRVASPPQGSTSSPSGTVVIWPRCDRLDNRRVSTIVRKLQADLGRRFRHYLWRGLNLTINDNPVAPFDPLYLNAPTLPGASLFSETTYEVSANASSAAETGVVTVRFSELPVHAWHALSNEEKRRQGISKGAGVSLVRAGREVDYGWFFLGAKHRENYDDWWRCEILFDPILDEAFGITHTKQQVRPQAHLLEALTADIEATARVLNSRARKAHAEIKAGDRFSATEQLAADRDHLLAPLPTKARPDAKARMAELERRHVSLRKNADNPAGASRYRVLEDSVSDTCFFDHAYDGDRLVLVLNQEHPFYREVYRPLVESDTPRDQQLRVKLELLLLAAARTEVAAKGASGLLAEHRREWSNTLATFLNR